MSDHAPPPSDPIAARIQRDLYYQAVHALTGVLPAPDDETVEEHIRRFNVAMSQVAATHPVNSDEVVIAARYVAAGAYADECMRQATYQANNPTIAAGLCRQAGSMMREARGFRSLLLRVQSARYKREANDKTREQDAWTEHVVLDSMTKALQDLAPMPRRAPPLPPAAPPARRPPAATPRRTAPDAPPRVRRTDAEMVQVLTRMTDRNGCLSAEAILREAGQGEDDIFFREPSSAGTN